MRPNKKPRLVRGFLRPLIMKKISKQQRQRDIILALLHRTQKRAESTRKNLNQEWLRINTWFEKNHPTGLSYTVEKKRALTLFLPPSMNFSSDYEITAKYITAIRLLTSEKPKSKKQYRLRQVNFDKLIKISSSAALVLTAELSKWDDSIRSNLTPLINNWDPNILQQFKDLGFFRLFAKSPTFPSTPSQSNINLVKYIKGSCGDTEKTRELKEEIQNIVGDRISKWTFLHSGLTEAITNVSHHAYPNHKNLNKSDKSWYLSGSYDRSLHELKISFYDQGIGIPKSLPQSEVWEKVLGFLSKLNIAKGKLDAELLRAAMEINRTSTGDSDRGKGLQDLLEFIRQRGEGYLSVLSRRGLYRFSLKDGEKAIKTHSFEVPLKGTLIIWSVSLAPQIVET